jgi:cytochrome c-type biogenesis protein CcmF
VLSWRRATASVLKRNLLIPVFVGVVGTIASIPFGVRDLYSIVCVFGAAFVAATIVMEFARGLKAREHVQKAALPAALLSLVQKNKRRYGGYIVHAGMVMLFVGVLGSSVFQKEAHKPLQKGESLEIGRYKLTLREIISEPQGNAMHTAAVVALAQNGRDIGIQKPARAVYTKSQQPMTEVALHVTPAEDLYLILAGLNEDGSASIQAYINPLVSLVWAGGVMMVFGTLITLSDRMRLRREEKTV